MISPSKSEWQDTSLSSFPFPLSSTRSVESSTLTRFDASRCLSFLTIENRGEIPDELAAYLDGSIYGCDRCQKACPWNRFATPNTTPELQPRAELLAMTREQWQQLSEDDYRKLFKGSAVKRAKYAGLMRNIKAADTGKD